MSNRRRFVGVVLAAAMMLPLLAARSAGSTPTTLREMVARCTSQVHRCAPKSPAARDCCCLQRSPAPELPRLLGAPSEHTAAPAAVHVTAVVPCGSNLAAAAFTRFAPASPPGNSSGAFSVLRI